MPAVDSDLTQSLFAAVEGASNNPPRLPFDALYTALVPVLRTVAIRKFGVPRRDAEDLIHDVFATYLAREAEVKNPPAYLYNAITKASIRYRSRRGGAVGHQIIDGDTAASRAEPVDRAVILLMTIQATMQKLGPSCRDTLYRFHVLGEKASSIARSRDTTENYIYRLLNYCRNRARDIYRRMDQEGSS